MSARVTVTRRLLLAGLPIACAAAIVPSIGSARGIAPISPSRDAPTVAQALSSSQAGGSITSASFGELPPTGGAASFACSDGIDNDGDSSTDEDFDPQCSSEYDDSEAGEALDGEGSDDEIPAAAANTELGGFGGGSDLYAILSTGDATSADAPNEANDLSVDLGGTGYDARDGGTNTIRDLTTLRIGLDVPAGSSCLRLDYRFLSEEFPEYVGRSVNDFFVAELDANTFTASGDGREVLDPDNFAVDPRGQLISVNTAEFTEEGAAGTTYDGASDKLVASTPITPGAHVLYLSIADQGDSVYDSSVLIDGLRFTSTGSCAVPEDAVAPDTEITSGPDGDTDDPTPTFEFASSEQDSTFECSLDGASFSDCDSPLTSAALADGDHSLRVRAIDDAGNVDATADRRYFRVDTGSNPPADDDPPSVTITSGPADGSTTDDSTPTFEFSSDEPGVTFECRLVPAATFEGEFEDCESPLTLDELADGGYVLFVQAADRAQNVARDQRGFFVDDGSGPGGAPQTRITTAPKKVVKTKAKSIKARFGFASNQPGSTFACSLDGKPFKPCTSPFAATLRTGRHSFAVRASAGGATDPSPAKATVTVKRKRGRG